MAATGKQSDLDFKVSTDAEKAISDLTRIIAKQDGSIKKLKESNAEAKKTQREMKKAMMAMAEGGDKAAKKTGKVKDEMSGVGKAAAGSMTAVRNWIAGFAGLSTVATVLNGIVSSMREAAEMQKEMLSESESLESIVMKIAHLRKDASTSGQLSAQRDVAAIAQSSHVPLPVAAETLFFSESSFAPGSAAAKSSAAAIADFAAPAGLTPEQVKGLPKIFSAFGADTRAKQDTILNQLVAGTGGSSAETGEYIQPLVGLTNVFKSMGFTFEQTLARMTAQIEVSGSVSKAAEDARRFAEIASGRRTEKAMDFMSEHAKAKGVDFASLSVPERVEFFEKNIFDEYAKSGRLDELSTVLGGESFNVVQLGASATARSKYANILPAIQAATSSSYVQDMAGDFAGTITARSADRQARKTLARAALGREKEPQARLEEMTADIYEIAFNKADTFPELLDRALLPKGLEKRHIAADLIRENLYLARESAPAADQNKYTNMLKRLDKITSFRANPEFVRQAYEMTHGFEMPYETGRIFWNDQLPSFRNTDAGRYSGKVDYSTPGFKRYLEAIEDYFNVGKGENGEGGGEAIKEHTEALKANAAATEELTKAMNRRQPEFADPVGGLD